MLKLKTLRKSRRLSLKDMGDILGVAESTVSLYENSKREAPYEILKKLSKYFSVSIDYLLDNCDGEDGNTNSLKIPIIDSVTVSKNDELEFNYSDNHEDFELGDLDGYFFFKAHDDSMEPQISSGDTAIVKRQNDILSGDLAAVIFNQSPIMLKRVICENGVLFLQSFNHKEKNIIISENDSLIILGRVIQTIKKW